MIRYYAPFNKPSIKIGQSDVESILAAAQRPTTASLDGESLRKREHSDKLGFVRLKVTLDADSEYGQDDLVSALSRSEVRGIRGSRAVMIDDDYDLDEDDNETYTAWVGRNVWYNEHRLTAGWPSTEDEHDLLEQEIEDRFNGEVYVKAYVNVEGEDYDDEVGDKLTDDEADSDDCAAVLITGATVEVSREQLRTLATALKMIGETVLEILDADETQGVSEPVQVDKDDSDIRFSQFGNARF